ncbi:60S ribosomal subunit biogenesis protein-like protein Nop16 [Aureobasidium pullulans]|nr:60S ribosomal subunit biogenesis protein-like protein Nop16 [Aureobasidium pullulans]
MGRELQKKKNRSSTAKITKKAKSKKKLLQNPIIAANWNQKETLSQNYRRLGLVSKLNHPTGGVEKTSKTLEEAANGLAPEPTPDNLNISTKLPTQINISEVKIRRDPETGAILQVLDERKANPLNDPLNDVEDNDHEGWEGFVNEHGVLDGARQGGDARTDVIRQLEEQASRPIKKAPRKQSEREEEWIERLIQKHGDDYLGMARDMKLNPMQQSVGDLKKRVKKWSAKNKA